MIRPTELAQPASALAVALAAVLGGAFLPEQRLTVGLALSTVFALAVVRWPGSARREELLVLGLPMWGAVSALVVGAAPLASKETVTGWVIAWALWSLARRGDSRSLQTALQIVAAAAAVVAAAVPIVALKTGSIRVGGLFENPNLAAALLVAALPVGRWVSERPWFRVGWLAVLASAVLLTGSRAGVLAAVVIGAVLAPRGRARFIGIMVGGALGVLAVVWRFVSQPDVLAWHRVSIWRAVLGICWEHPWTGVGPGSLVEAAGVARIPHPEQVGQYQFVVSFAESTPLAVLVQLGVVGAILVAVAAAVWSVSARASGALSCAAFRASLAGVVTFSLFHDVLTLDVVLWWWALVLGSLEARGSARAIGAGRRQIWWGARIPAGAVLVWLTLWGVVAPAHARVAAALSEPTTAAVERILRLEPWYDEPPARRVQLMLADSRPWSWADAAEGLYWAREAARVHPGLARRWADLGKVHLRVLTDLGGTDHDAAAAKSALVRACELDPHLPWHWLERARLERVLGRHDTAVTYCRRALEEEPNTVRGWLMLARLELELGRVDQARAAYTEAVSRASLIENPSLTEYERELLLLPAGSLAVLEPQLGWAEPESR